MDRTSAFVVGGLIVGLFACSSSSGDDASVAGDSASQDGTLPAQTDGCATTAPVDPATLPKCACAKGGAARCVAKANLSTALSSQLDACDDAPGGGVCVPDTLVKSGGAAPKSCTSPFGEGRCMSLCIPQVAENAAVLNRGEGDVCAADELCAPCTNPLKNGESTGVCEIGAPSDPSQCVQGQAKGAAPPPAACAPPKTCGSVAGAEGRCLPSALPPIAAQKDFLPKDVCGAAELCAPCFDPSTGKATGACSTVACDAPVKPAVKFSDCCKMHGTTQGKCVPKTAIPAAQQSMLDDDGCKSAELCVASENLDPTFKPAACAASSLLLGKYTGVCVSDCVDLGIQAIALDNGNCSQDHTCVPCVEDGKPTGAPGCAP